MSDLRLVLITWVDSCQPTARWEWLHDLKSKKPVRCYTVGWIIQDDDEVKVLAQSIGSIDDNEKAQATGVMTIPTRCVEKIENVESLEAEEHPEQVAAE